MVMGKGCVGIGWLALIDNPSLVLGIESGHSVADVEATYLHDPDADVPLPRCGHRVSLLSKVVVFPFKA